jgi:hypothetical protein
MTVDVASFTDSRRSGVHRLAVHDGLYGVLEQAFGEADIQWNTCLIEDRGDGALILVPPEVPKVTLADQLAGRLLAGLRRYNAVHSSAAAIQLRVALHAGEVRIGEDGKVGDALNFAFRILEAPDAKTALRKTACTLALIASDSFYRDAILTDPAADATSFRQIPVAVKQTRAVAWLRLFGPTTVVGEGDYQVLDLLPEEEMSRLRDLLGDRDVPQLPTLVGRAAGPAVPPIRRDANAWDAVSYLLDFNAGADGLPPALSFVELLARQFGGAVGSDLMDWNDTQADRLHLRRQLRDRRTGNLTPVETELRLHLMILVQHDGMDPTRFVLSHWCQHDPREWPPARGASQAVSLDELEQTVDELVLAAEEAWVGHQGSVALEFVLPRALLNLPVDRWSKEHASGDPRPLRLDYPIVVRSFERMTSPYWHRVWRKRWQTLATDTFAAEVYYATADDAAEPRRVDVALQDPQLVAMVLHAAPTAMPQPGDELSAALRAGFPAVLWRRDTTGAEELREAVTFMSRNGLRDLPAGSLSARREALHGRSAEFDVVEDLVLLWDDPERVVVVDRSMGIRVMNEDIAGQSERAS